jgi:hypothetical protein
MSLLETESITMKGFTAAILAALPLLITAAIVIRACSSTSSHSERTSGIASAIDASKFSQTQQPEKPPPTSVNRLLSPEHVERGFRGRHHELPLLPSQAAMGEQGTSLQQPIDEPSSSPSEQILEEDGSENDPPETQTGSAVQLTLDQTATSSTSLRNAGFPRTYIRSIRVDLTSPNHWVRLNWTGPDAASQERGPFHSSPGRGLGNNDCDDVDESNRDGSNCTPKGTFTVQGCSDSMPSYTHCRFVTWFQVARGVAFHYYPNVPNYPASHGCVRLNAHAAQLIHNNSKIGSTEVVVDGKWRFAR